MEFQCFPLDITYCSNTDCNAAETCERHPDRLAQLRNSGVINQGDMVSIADFSGTCGEYIKQIVYGKEQA